jgi:hypothetical protein
MDGQQVCESLGISSSQRRWLLRTGHLRRGRIDPTSGKPCPHDDTLGPCSCAWDYDAQAVQSLGYLGTADRVPAGKRARPLPARFRYDPEAASEEIALDLAERERRRRRRHVSASQADDEPWTGADEQSIGWGWAVTVAAVLITGLGLAWCRIRLPASEAMAPP